jgi:hypothetical protein
VGGSTETSSHLEEVRKPSKTALEQRSATHTHTHHTLKIDSAHPCVWQKGGIDPRPTAGRPRIIHRFSGSRSIAAASCLLLLLALADEPSPPPPPLHRSSAAAAASSHRPPPHPTKQARTNHAPPTTHAPTTIPQDSRGRTQRARAEINRNGDGSALCVCGNSGGGGGALWIEEESVRGGAAAAGRASRPCEGG